jgi:pyridinium-3,5-bisthiocarboxylic acid mononucleotide nickel chelatase
MKVAYLDAFSGLSGDMTVGALLDCGLDVTALERELAKLDLRGYRVRRETRERSGIRATKFVLEIEDDHSPHRHSHGHSHGERSHRSFRYIRELIRQSALAPRVCELALQVFVRLAEAEGKVHGVEPDEVTFHEVGAIDSIVDIVGAAWGIDALGIEELVVSPLPLGSGMVRSAHGPLPVPGPATAELLRGFPVRIGDGQGELVTPTGAAIVAALARPGTMPESVRIERVGYGAGERELADRPNLLRVLVGERASAVGVDSLLVLETNLDDFNPELYGHVMDRLFAEGARDVFLTPIHMKKNRPAMLLSVLADYERREGLVATLFSETSTLGVRVSPVERLRIERESREVETRFGRVRVKLGRDPGGHVNVSPEYEDCRRVAIASGAPLKIVYQEAAAAALGALRSARPAVRRPRAGGRAKARRLRR